MMGIGRVLEFCHQHKKRKPGQIIFPTCKKTHDNQNTQTIRKQQLGKGSFRLTQADQPSPHFDLSNSFIIRHMCCGINNESITSLHNRNELHIACDVAVTKITCVVGGCEFLQYLTSFPVGDNFKAPTCTHVFSAMHMIKH